MHQRTKKIFLFGLGALALIIAGGAYWFHQHKIHQATQEWHWDLPKGFPEPLVPAINPMSEAKFQLGRHLFFDKRLSGNGTMGCGSCHFQNLAFTDGKAVATGSTGDHTARSAMSIVNVAYYPTFTWANPSQFSLEIQAAVPMFVDNLAVELGINDSNKDAVIARFQNDAYYQHSFKEAFPGEDNPINFMNIIKAISTFERGVISGNSRYDQAAAGEITLSVAEERGRKLFFSEQAQCSTCHSGFNFSDQTMDAKTVNADMPFHNTGLYNIDGKGAYPDSNPGLIVMLPGAENMGKFRVPSLRNIALTAPYMHDGSVATLEEVLNIYAAHGRNITSGPDKGDGRRNPLKDARINKIKLDKAERADIIAFLKTLTDESLLTNPRFADPFQENTAH
jgi:cytochrome c peroxidase